LKVKVLLAFISLTLISQPAVYAEDYVVPQLISFEFSPGEIDLTSASTEVKFDLKVFHPIGISSTRVAVNLTSKRGSTLFLNLNRSELPINLDLKTVTFTGTLTVPRNIATDVYRVESGIVYGVVAAGASNQPYSSKFEISKNINKLISAERDLVVRSGGELNYDYTTFLGPSHSTVISSERTMPNIVKTKLPIWRVGEEYLPSDYYEIRIPDMVLNVSSQSNLVCTSDGLKLKFVSEGDCKFTVFTNKTKDYMYKKSEHLVTISRKRTLQELTVEKVKDQNVENLPKKISIPRVYTYNLGYILPQTLTPSICLVSDGYVNIFSGGTCRYTYQAAESEAFLESKLYELSFEVVKNSQSITFSIPSDVAISKRSLTISASASSGLPITFSTLSTGICSISQFSVNLLKPGKCVVSINQDGNSTILPVTSTSVINITGVQPSKITSILCKKGKLTKKVNGNNPKCPKGYQVKTVRK